jgi:hypothetical protein
MRLSREAREQQREYREKLRGKIRELKKDKLSHPEIAGVFTKERLPRLSGKGHTWTHQDIGYLLYQGDAKKKPHNVMPAVSAPASDLEALLRDVLESNMRTDAKTDLMKILLARK